jgi:hypothetical protein
MFSQHNALYFFMMLILLFQDDEEEEEDTVPLVRKRKQPAVSTQQPSDGAGPAPKAEETKKAKRVEQTAGQQDLAQGQEEKKKKEKKGEDKQPATRKKTVAKMPRVPKALKIHSSSDNKEDKVEEPKSTSLPETSTKMVEEDQVRTAEAGDVSSPQHTSPQQNPMEGPSKSPLVEEQVGIDQGQDLEGQKHSPQVEPSAPNVEECANAPDQAMVEEKEVNTLLFLLFHFLFKPSFV